MKVHPVLPGSYHINEGELNALAGCPPEILKALLRQGLKVPKVAILPDLSHVQGVSQMALEFLGYWFLFVEQGYQKGQRFRVLGRKDFLDRLREILRLTLLGPSAAEMKRWGLSKARVEMLGRMSDGMAIKKDGKVLPVEDLFEFIPFPEDSRQPLEVFGPESPLKVRSLGFNRFEFSSGGKKEVLDLNFDGEQVQPLVDLTGEVEKPEKLRVKVLGCFSGFDPSGPTTGMLFWVNANAFLVDVPSGVGRYLRQVGVAKDQLTAVIQTHIHDDHSSLSEMVLSEKCLTLISTREIYECAVAKVAHTLGESLDVVKRMLKFIEITPGRTYSMFGARWEFFYTVHSIPTFGFRVTVLDDEGKAHTVLHSSDLDHFKGMDGLVEAGAVSPEHRDRMKALVRGDERLAMLDAGGGMIHGEPQDWLPSMERCPNTEFLFYHVNPSRVDTARYQVAGPGWAKTLLPSRSLAQSVYTGVLRGLQLFEVKDPAWINVILSQGQVVEFPAGREVVTKGQEGDSFYFVLNGALDVLDPGAKGPELLATLESGDFFGEMSLINHNRISATVVARTPVVLFRLRGELFLEFVEENELKDRFQNLWMRRPLISSVSLFRDVDPTARHEISMLARKQAFAKGDLIVRQGGKTDDFYVITGGKVEIFREGAKKKEEFSTTLGAGDFFGENVAMGYTDRRNASAKALTEVSALVLSGAELRDLAKRMPILRHKLHVIMRDRGVKSEVLEKAVQAEPLAVSVP